MGLWTLDQVNKGKVIGVVREGREVVTCQTVGVVEDLQPPFWTPKEPAKSQTAFIAGMACRCICIGIPSIVDEDDPANRYADTPEGRIFIKTTRWEIARSDEDENPIIISGPAKKAAEQLMTMEV